ncbi:MAG TPA: tetratricopeptide repeat protein, partial [Gemmatimonadales bacterium]|nr:tetratricopeptide repeat protein [Gemmatimonadales bacterium]
AELARALAAGHGSEPATATDTAARVRESRPKMSRAVVFVLGLLVTATMGLLLWQRGDRPAGPGGTAAQRHAEAVLGTQPPALTEQPSVAVLPFANLSPDPANEYFSDGMTEELITALSQVEGLRVAARASSFAFKGKPLDVAEVAQKLNVGAVLDGSVRRAGQRLRVTAELVDARGGTRLWAERYDRELRDVFQVQDELARAIVGALQVPLKLTSRSDTALVRAGTRDPAAHDLYLQGRFLWNQRTHEALSRAIGYFERAIGRDSSYAEAYAGLADCYLLLPQTGPARPRDMYPKAKQAVEHALELDSTLAEAHTSIALLRMQGDYDWHGAEAGFQRALALNPSYATAHQWYSSYLAATGRPEEALAEILRAQALDPLSRVISANVAQRLAYLGRYDEALRQIRSTIELDPNFPNAHSGLCQVYALQGLPRQAIAPCERASALLKRPVGLLAYVQAASGNRTRATAIVRELVARSRREYVAPVGIAIGYFGLGDSDATFAWLDSAYAVRDPGLTTFFTSPLSAPLYSDPRTTRLRTRMGLPP